jgi:integrase
MPPDVSKEAAGKQAALWSKDAAAGKILFESDVQVEGPETFADWVKRWIEARSVRGIVNAPNDAKTLGKWVTPTLGPQPIANITRSDIEALVEELDRGVQAGKLSWKTAANVWGLVSKAFADAHNAKERALRVRDDNPASDVRGPDRGARKGKQWLHPKEVLAAMAVDDEPIDVRRALALNVYLYCRPGELRALEWADVDLEAGIVRVHRAEMRDGTTKPTKTKRTRPVPIEPTLRPLLLAMHEETDGKGKVAPGLPKDTVLADVLIALLERAKVKRPDLYVTDATRKRVTWYDLRATGITWRAIRGDEPLRIMRSAGHSDFATTLGYIREAEAVGAGFGGVFPALPDKLLRPPSYAPKRPKLSKSWWVDRE